MQRTVSKVMDWKGSELNSSFMQQNCESDAVLRESAIVNGTRMQVCEQDTGAVRNQKESGCAVVARGYSKHS